MTQEFQKPFTSPPTIFSVALVLGLLIGWLMPWRVLPLPLQLILGPLLIAAGVFVIWRSIQDIETAGTTYDPYSASTALVTAGVYRHSRNPGYLGLAIIQFGVAILLDNLWIVGTGIIAVLVTSHFVIRLEERKLTRAFGDPYTSYMQQVRRWL
ncbi:isoprenylcysteine carboxylmethyltransferase family protein [Yoonia sp. R2331]|uniref:methyltransferase family protein n=1 Tax=Yoonia sp. R2331 TaxID=3237238 RepID=UPI0034E564F5